MLLLLLISSAFLLPWAGTGRIIGGKEVRPHSRPYMAYLDIQFVNQSGSMASFCGGFLIRPDAVLSAAHCVPMEGRVNITVTLGAHNVRVREQSQQRIPVERWVIHPNYSPIGWINDIVLLKLKTKAEINENVQIISIPSSNESVTAGTTCSVAGWGWTSLTGNTTDVMMEVELKVQNEEPCKRKFSNYKPLSVMCVGDQNSAKSTYKVFTRVSYFEPWIREQLRKFALQELPGSPSSD